MKGSGGRTVFGLAAIAAAVLCTGAAHAATITKANNADDLNLASSWIGGVLPGTNDIARWDVSVAANTVSLGADLSWRGLAVDSTHTNGTITITAGSTLSLGRRQARYEGLQSFLHPYRVHRCWEHAVQGLRPWR